MYFRNLALVGRKARSIFLEVPRLYHCHVTSRAPSSRPDEKGLDSPVLNSQKPAKKETLLSKYREEIYTVPNLITYARMGGSPVLGLAIAYDYKTVAIAGCALAAFSDWLDGYIAKNYNQMTVLGGMLDPAADKIMIACLTLGCSAKGLVPLELAALIIGRDLLLLGASFALRYREMPVGSPFFDTTYSATFEIIPSQLSKVNTVFQFGLVTTTLCNWALNAPPILDQVILPLQGITALTTLGSLVGYLDGSAIKRISPTGVGIGHKRFDVGQTNSELGRNTHDSNDGKDSEPSGSTTEKEWK